MSNQENYSSKDGHGQGYGYGYGHGQQPQQPQQPQQQYRRGARNEQYWDANPSSDYNTNLPQNALVSPWGNTGPPHHGNLPNEQGTPFTDSQQYSNCMYYNQNIDRSTYRPGSQSAMNRYSHHSTSQYADTYETVTPASNPHHPPYHHHPDQHQGFPNPGAMMGYGMYNRPGGQSIVTPGSGDPQSVYNQNQYGYNPEPWRSPDFASPQPQSHTAATGVENTTNQRHARLRRKSSPLEPKRLLPSEKKRRLNPTQDDDNDEYNDPSVATPPTQTNEQLKTRTPHLAIGQSSSSGPSLQVDDDRPTATPSLICRCVKSRCLKLYCDCFQAETLCNSFCQCINCHNTMAQSKVGGALYAVREEYLAFKPEAFGKKKKEPGSGCACKNNRCLKKYCDCFNNGLSCSPKCKCVDCDNRSTSVLKKERKRLQEETKDETTNNEGTIATTITPITTTTVETPVGISIPTTTGSSQQDNQDEMRIINLDQGESSPVLNPKSVVVAEKNKDHSVSVVQEEDPTIESCQKKLFVATTDDKADSGKDELITSDQKESAITEKREVESTKETLQDDEKEE